MAEQEQVKWILIFLNKEDGSRPIERLDFPTFEFWQPDKETCAAEGRRVLRELRDGGDACEWIACGFPDPFAVGDGRASRRPMVGTVKEVVAHLWHRRRFHFRGYVTVGEHIPVGAYGHAFEGSDTFCHTQDKHAERLSARLRQRKRRAKQKGGGRSWQKLRRRVRSLPIRSGRWRNGRGTR